jgi:Yip1-like protein
MDEQSNAPLPAPAAPGGMAGWFSVWMAAVTKPYEQTFAEMAASPNAKATTAYIWVFLGSLVSFFLASLVQGVAMRQLMQQYGMENQFGSGGIGTRLITIVCGAPISAVISVVLFAVVVGIIQFLAKSFGGRGTFDQLAYTFAAIYTPFTLLSGVLTLLSAIPYVGYCFTFISLLALLYVLALQVMAVKGVNQFGWGQAAGSYFLPVLVLCCCLAVVAFGIGSLVAQAINNGSFQP